MVIARNAFAMVEDFVVTYSNASPMIVIIPPLASSGLLLFFSNWG